MKILYNIAGTCHAGGMERVLANKANWLVKNGYEVVFTRHPNVNFSMFSSDNTGTYLPSPVFFVAGISHILSSMPRKEHVDG